VPGADGPRCPGGRSVRCRRTVREVSTDGPKLLCEQPVLHLEIRTVRTLPVDGARATCATRTVRDPQADGPQTPCNKTQLVQQIEPWTHKNKWRTGRTLGHMDYPHLPSGLSARCEQSSSSPKMRSQPLLSIHGSPKRLELLRKDLGEMWSIPRRCYTQKLETSNKLNWWESNRNRALPKSLGSNRNPLIGGRIQSLRHHDQAQRCPRKLSMIPTNKLEPKHFRSEGTRRA
jgi:hypothetical protein